jgi:predicted Fe-Mo cluster-binding NifX family protein
MKIAFPLLNENVLAIDFSHSNYIGIYDVGKDWTDIINIQAQDKKLEMMESFKSMNSQGLTHVISPFYSYMTLRIFKEIQIKPLKAKGTSLHENIKSFQDCRLLPFEVNESLLFGECARDCLSCAPDCTDN